MPRRDRLPITQSGKVKRIIPEIQRFSLRNRIKTQPGTSHENVQDPRQVFTFLPFSQHGRVLCVYILDSRLVGHASGTPDHVSKADSDDAIRRCEEAYRSAVRRP